MGHRYLEYCYTKLGKSTGIDLWKTITPNKFHIYIAQCTYTHGRLSPPPPPIQHRSLENHYTKYVSYIAQCRFNHGRLTPLKSCIDALNTATPTLGDLLTDLPITQSIKHRCLEYHYTKLSRSTGHRSLENHYTK